MRAPESLSTQAMQRQTPVKSSKSISSQMLTSLPPDKILQWFGSVATDICIALGSRPWAWTLLTIPCLPASRAAPFRAKMGHFQIFRRNCAVVPDGGAVEGSSPAAHL
uniref:Uncharacterized protein n=1 Tax=Eutreptiella gymnastica TaxID=73025 RepID=A0A7S4CUH2_9EUGL